MNSSSISLTWTLVPTALFYVVRRGGNIVNNNVVGLSYTDVGLSASTTYSYTVAAVNLYGEGPVSAPASATTQASTISFLTTSPLPAATQNSPYSASVSASGGTAPYSFVITSGSLDAGLSFSSLGVFSGTPLNAETDTLIIKATDSLGANVSQTFSLTVNAAVAPPAGNPNLSVLPQGSWVIGNYNSFPGTAWATNTPFKDDTGVYLTRLTNASTLGGLSCTMEYGPGGSRISQPWGAGLNRYWVVLTDAEAGGQYVASVTLSYPNEPTLPVITLDSSPAIFRLPVGSAHLGVSFSKRPGEADILYLAYATAEISRYNVRTHAYAPNSVFNSGTGSASIAVSGINPGWLYQNWDGTRMTFQVPFGTPTAVGQLNPTTGSITYYTGKELNGTDGTVNEAALTKGTSNLVVLKQATPINDGTSFWFVDTNVATKYQTAHTPPFSGHTDSGEFVYYGFDPNTAAKPLEVSTFGTAPGADGGAYAGTVSSYFNVGSGNQVDGGADVHPSMNWDQTGSGSKEYYCYSVQGNILGPQYPFSAVTSANPATATGGSTTTVVVGSAPWSANQYQFGFVTMFSGANAGLTRAVTSNTTTTLTVAAFPSSVVAGDQFYLVLARVAPTGWTVSSGSIYKSVVQFGSPGYPPYGSNTRGVTEVALWNGIVGLNSSYTGKLTLAPSLAGMTAGTFFYDAGTTTCYVWIAAGGDPTAKVWLMSPGYHTESIGYARQDGADKRRLCFGYQNSQDAVYSHLYYANCSPDGKFWILNTNLLTFSGRSDLMAAGVPTS